MSSYKDELIRRGIECRISRGRSGALIFYGDRHETDCRGAGMKRFSIGVDGDGSHYIYTWGQTEKEICLLYTSPSPRDATLSRMPSSA